MHTKNDLLGGLRHQIISRSRRATSRYKVVGQLGHILETANVIGLHHRIIYRNDIQFSSGPESIRIPG